MNPESQENLAVEKSIKDNVLRAVEDGKVRMKPRWHFVLRTALLASGTLLILLMTLYISSFIVFSLRQSGIIFIPYFGIRGLPILFKSMPWILVGLTFLCMILLEILARHYAFTYDKPFIYSILAIVAWVIFGGTALGLTSLHTWHRDPLSYSQPEDVTIGIVTDTSPNLDIIRDPNGLFIKVQVTDDTLFLDGIVKDGDKVLIIGDRRNGQIRAEGIKKLSATISPMPMVMQSQ